MENQHLVQFTLVKHIKMPSKFKKEFKKQIRLAIAAAIGFIIAYSWREFIVGVMTDKIGNLTKVENLNLLNLTSAFVITLIGVIIILITSNFLKN